MSRGKVFKPAHAEPSEMRLDYVLLPYGEFYDKTKVFLDAKRGDTLRLYNGGEYAIDSVHLISDLKLCEALSRMRYGVAWYVAFRTWLSYAKLEGHGKDVLDPGKCIMVVFKR